LFFENQEYKEEIPEFVLENFNTLTLIPDEEVPVVNVTALDDNSEVLDNEEEEEETLPKNILILIS